MTGIGTTDKEASIAENSSDGPLTKVIGESQNGQILDSQDVSLLKTESYTKGVD